MSTRPDIETHSIKTGLLFDRKAPKLKGGIRNFAWVVDGRLARGEQPPLVLETFASLRRMGIGEILSLREDYESAKADWPEYSSSIEKRLCGQAGIIFSKVPCTDFAAPSPAQARAALEVIDAAVDSGRSLYVHCLAGVGRTGVVTSTWGLSRGQDAEWAAQNYAVFLEDMVQRRKHQNDRAAYYARLNTAEQLWGLRSIARALGVDLPGIDLLPAPREPAQAVGWVAEYETLLRPWRDRRLLISPGPYGASTT